LIVKISNLKMILLNIMIMRQFLQIFGNLFLLGINLI